MLLDITNWRKSSYSGQAGSCVEVGFGTTAIGVRDTKDRDAGTLALSGNQWASFLHAIKQDRYGHP